MARLQPSVLALGILALAALAGLQVQNFLVAPTSRAPPATSPSGSSVALRGGAGSSNLGAPFSSRRSTSAHGLLQPSVAILASLAGVAALCQRSARRGSVSRQVTMQEIRGLTTEQVPLHWARKVNLGMARRYELCMAIREKLDESFFVMAINRDGMTENELTEARKLFPPQVTVRALKGNLVKKAMEGTEWDVLSPHLKGSNLYVFVPEDTYLKPTIEGYIKFEKDFERDEKVAAINELYVKTAARGGFQLQTTCPGGVLRDEWNLITKEELPKLKNFPTKLELISQIAGSIKQVPTKLAVGSKQLSQKLAIGTKKIVEKMEEESKATVAEVVA